MKDMSSRYVQKTHFEGHDNFLRLLYMVETQTAKIDLTIKPSDVNIDGKIARERKFDPENLERALDSRELNVDDSIGTMKSLSRTSSEKDR
jgi:hypothetical protein